MLESTFKTKLVKELKDMLPGCIVLHLSERQGYPDLLILYEDTWAALEGKQFGKASRRPNQEYYINKMDNMSFASFIYPENKEEVLYDLQQALRP